MSSNDYANVNGFITPLDRAVVPVSDHGFLYGDSVYETVRTYGRRPFLLRQHLQRLARSAEAIRLRLPWEPGHLTRQIDLTIDAATGGRTDHEFAIRIMATRGPGPLGYDPDLCPTPTLAIIVRPLHPMSTMEREGGVAAIISTVRRNPIESLDPRIKSSNLLNNILAAQQAGDAGAFEAILFNTAGEVAEGTLTNIFMVKSGRIQTPSVDCGILSGVTRELVFELAAGSGQTIEEGRYRREALAEADEIFLTSTTREIIPVSRLDGRLVGKGRPGPVTLRLRDLFARRIADFLAEAPPPAGPNPPDLVPKVRARAEAPRVGIFVDVQNMYYAARQLNARLDFGALMLAATRDRRLIRATAYVVQNRDIDQSGFLAMLQQKNYEVRRKPLKIRHDGSSKGDWDMEMALDILEMAPGLDIVVLVTGDGDFVPLVSRIKTLGPRVEVFSFPGSTARELIEITDRHVPLDEGFLIRPAPPG